MDRKNCVIHRRLKSTVASVLCLLVIGASLGKPINAQEQEPSTDDIPLTATVSPSPTDVPEWVSRGPYSENGTVYLVAQTNHPYTTLIEADAALIDSIRDTIQHHFEQQAGQALPLLPISDTDIKAKLLVPGKHLVAPYDENFSADLVESYGGIDHETFYRAFAQVQLDETFLATTTNNIQRHAVRFRLQLASLFAFGLLSLLSILFVCLRIDHATRGYYNRRLQTIGVLLAVVVFAMLYWAFFSLQ